MSTQLEQQMVHAIRVLAIDAVDRANSGHPGLPLGAAAEAFAIYGRQLKHSPKCPEWFDRDRFILSAGHGSAMLYALLHLFGYPMSIEDLKGFRQWEQKCCGHPEYDPKLGIEMTTGPLGQGVATAVGLAIAERHLAERFNRPEHELIDHYTYALCGDGCMMEGISGEAASLAGTLGLGKLIVVYDDNGISIDGSTDITFLEDVGARYEAYGWQVLHVDDANDVEAISAAIERAKADLEHPSLIVVRSEIGYGSPVQGLAKSHGAPLGLEASQKTRESLGWTETEPFVVPQEIQAAYAKRVAELNQNVETWETLWQSYRHLYPEEATLLEALMRGERPKLLADPHFAEFEPKSMATRDSSHQVLNRIVAKDPFFIGGSADLAGSNKTDLTGQGYIQKGAYSGRNVHFGVREHAMAAVTNGLALHGLHPFCATFLVFSDYARGAMRLSALMNLPVIYVMTHDSIGVGEDGPTHEPIEHLASLRAMPNFEVWRPADARETAYAYASLYETQMPGMIAATRSATGILPQTGEGALKGAYLYCESHEQRQPELILMATGSELEVAAKAYELLREKQPELAIRLVSIPCLERFEQQELSYREELLPQACRARVVVEAGSAQSWGAYLGFEGRSVCIDHFGASAPAAKLFEAFGFTPENVVAKALESLEAAKRL